MANLGLRSLDPSLDSGCPVVTHKVWLCLEAPFITSGGNIRTRNLFSFACPLACIKRGVARRGFLSSISLPTQVQFQHDSVTVWVLVGVGKTLLPAASMGLAVSPH